MDHNLKCDPRRLVEGAVASNLEVLLLILTASHPAANRSSAHRKRRSVEASWMTSLKNSRGGTLMSPNWTLSRPWLRLDVSSMNITYGGSRQAALSESHAQLNMLDLVPNTRYPVHILVDCSSDPGSPYCADCTVFLTYPQAWIVVWKYMYIKINKPFYPHPVIQHRLNWGKPQFLTRNHELRAKGDPN